MGILSNLKNRIVGKFQSWREVGEYRSTFKAFGNNAYKSEIVRSCVRPLADFTSKAHCRSTDADVERLLNGRPNMYMNGSEFLQKVRTHYELRNNAFIFIDRNDRGKVVGFYPISNYSNIEALEYGNGLFIKFNFTDGSNIVLPWADLAVLRKDYNESNIVGDDNSVILNTLELINTTNQGVANAVRATANLRGILKSTKAMLADEALKAQRDKFVREYLSLENEGGIASLDATQEFMPISMSPVITTFEQMREFRENVYRYFGVNDDIIMSKVRAEELEVVYELKIEPFLKDLATELTTKVFTAREIGFGNWIVFESNKLQFSSISKKVTVFKDVVLYGGMTINEWRLGCNLPPIEGGDELIRRLDAAPVEDEPPEEEEEEVEE